MHVQCIDTRGFNCARQFFERSFRVLLVDADAAFHRDRNPHGRLHRRDAIADKLRLRHQAGAEATLLHAVGRAPHVQVHLAVAEVLGNLRAFGQRAWVRAAKLDRDGLLGLVERQQPLAVAMDDGGGR